MKKKAGIFVGIIAAALILTLITTTAFAAFQPKRGIELAADVLGVTVDELIDQRDETGKTIHEILEDADKLDEFTDAHLAQFKQILTDKVTNGDLTQAEADEWYKEIEERMEENIANGTYGRVGTGYGMMGGYFNNGTGYGGCSGTGTRRGGGFRYSK
jgi:divalent metal cation (Fe/Co/Zn/Cd) transporter